MKSALRGASCTLTLFGLLGPQHVQFAKLVGRPMVISSSPSRGNFATSLRGRSENAATQALNGNVVDMACAALASSVATGNRPQFDAIVSALKILMPDSELTAPLKAGTLEREDFSWQEHDFMDGPEENLRVLQDFEAQFTRIIAYSPDGFRDPKVLCAGLDMACAYIKNYALDKADALYTIIQPHCLERGMPWDVKCLQDMATLRCKQARQPEAAVLLEEVAKRSPPHSATLRNLGTVYNMLGHFEKAQDYFNSAMELDGNSEPDKDDLWYLGIAKKNLGLYDEALPMLIKALELWKIEEGDDDVTLGKLHDTVGSCYDLMGRHNEAVEEFSQARVLFGRSIGAESPLYGSACEGLTKALVHAGRFREGFDALEEAFENNAGKDAIHPTPLFELLGYALQDCVEAGGIDHMELGRLEKHIGTAVRNMRHRQLDQDGNAGVVYERMAQVLLRCGMAQGDEEQQRIAARRRELSRELLEQAGPLVEAATSSGEADLTHISQLIRTQLQVLDAQDGIYLRALSPPAQEAPQFSAGASPVLTPGA